MAAATPTADSGWSPTRCPPLSTSAPCASLFAWAAPHVAGRVRCSPQLDRLDVRIRLRAPTFGELVRYGGSMDIRLEERT